MMTRIFCLTLPLLFTSCQFLTEKSPATLPTKTVVKKQPVGDKLAESVKISTKNPPKPSVLGFRKALLAKKKADGAWSMRKSDIPTFVAGEKIGLILFDVSGFHKNINGKNHMEVDILVVSPASKIIVDKKNTMGKRGKINLDNNTAKSPFGLFQSKASMQAGTYKMQLTVHDKIGQGELKHSMYFELEKSSTGGQ